MDGTLTLVDGSSHVPVRTVCANSPSTISFVTPAIAKKYDFDLPEYEGIDQIVEVGPNGQKL